MERSPEGRCPLLREAASIEVSGRRQRSHSFSVRTPPWPFPSTPRGGGHTYIFLFTMGHMELTEEGVLSTVPPGKPLTYLSTLSACLYLGLQA